MIDLGVGMTARLLLAFSVLACAAAPAVAAKQIVVRSSGPSAKAYPVGKQLAEGSQVSLRAGDRLTVLGPAKALVLQGPGNFKLAAAASVDAFNRSRFSARRGPPLPRGPWAIDVAQSGPVCAPRKQPLSLWRANGDDDTKVSITGPDGKTTTLEWPAGNETLAWPENLPLDDGSSYKVQVAGQATPGEWKIASIGPWPMDRSTTAEALLAKGCEPQLEELVERALWGN